MKPFKRTHSETIQAEDSIPTNGYYESISERFGIAQVLLYLALLAFVAVSFLSNTGLITYQNLYYFVKDLGASAESVDVLHTDSVSYPTDASQSFTLYRRGLAVAGNTSVTVFTASGRQTISKNQQYQDPVAVGSGKYLLVYELGGNQYSLYNSYTRIFSGKTDAVIRGGAVSESGSYALILQNDQSPSTVQLYNSDFDLIGKYPRNGYVTDVALNSKGDHLAILTSKNTNGSFSTAVQIFEQGETEMLSETPVSNSLGLQCSFTESGDVAILCTNGVYYASIRGKLISELDFEGKKLVSADQNAFGCAVVLKKSANSEENIAIVFDKSGKMLYNNSVADPIDSIALYQGVIFLSGSDGILRIQLSDGASERLSCVTDRRVLLAVDETKVLLCSPQKADAYRFGS